MASRERVPAIAVPPFDEPLQVDAAQGWCGQGQRGHSERLRGAARGGGGMWAIWSCHVKSGWTRRLTLTGQCWLWHAAALGLTDPVGVTAHPRVA